MKRALHRDRAETRRLQRAHRHLRQVAAVHLRMAIEHRPPVRRPMVADRDMPIGPAPPDQPQRLARKAGVDLHIASGGKSGERVDLRQQSPQVGRVADPAGIVDDLERVLGDMRRQAQRARRILPGGAVGDRERQPRLAVGQREQIQSTYAVLGFGYGYLTTYRGFTGQWAGPASWDQVNKVGLAVSQAISWSGDRFLLEGNYGRVSVASSYVSGAAVNATDTFQGTLASLGLSPGTYDYTAGTESVRVVIGASGSGGTGAVPEPATWSLMIAGFGLIGASLRRRRGVAAEPA